MAIFVFLAFANLSFQIMFAYLLEGLPALLIAYNHMIVLNKYDIRVKIKAIE